MQTPTSFGEAYRLFACSGLLSNHESPLRAERFVTRKIIAAAKRISIGSNEILKLGDINIIRDWGWAQEYVEAMWLMLQQDEPDDYVIATGKSYPLQQFVEEAFTAVGLVWQDYVELNTDLVVRPTDISVSRVNPSKAREKLQKNLPIGSGVTEAACKTLVKQRLCGSGMRWKNQGAKVILSLRALVQSKGRWQQFWDKIDQYGSHVYV